MMVRNMEYEYIQGHEVIPPVYKLLLIVSWDLYDSMYKKTWLHADVRIDRMIVNRVEGNLRLV